MAGQLESLVDSARTGSGLATVYRALDELVELYALDDAAVVVDVPGFGRQVLHAGRRPLRNDEHGCTRRSPASTSSPRSTTRCSRGSCWRSARSGSATTRRERRRRESRRPVNLDELELELRRLPGVVAVGFVETDGVLVVELQAGADAYDDLARDATVLAVAARLGPGRGRGRAVG